jgi:hypothetical protein
MWGDVMGETTEYPMVLDIIATHEQGFVFRDGFYMGKLAKELGALLADRDAWRAKAEARPEAPGRRLREYEHGTHRYRVEDGEIVCAERGSNVWRKADWVPASALDSIGSLVRDPFEPVETLEGVVVDCLSRTRSETSGYRTIDEAVAETCARLRTWLAQQPAPTLTAAQHVAALVGMGAERRQYYDVHDDGDVLERCGLAGQTRADVLVLPPEATP